MSIAADPLTRVQFFVLGRVRMTVDGADQPLGGPFPQAVLARLIVNANHMVSTHDLARAVSADDPSTKEGVQTVISKLRRLLKECGLPADTILKRASQGYRLTVAPGGSDLLRWKAEKSAGATARTNRDFVTASAHFGAALAEWKGPSLDGLRETAFARRYVEDLDEEKLVVTEWWAESETACGRAHDAIPVLKGLTVDHTLREPLWVQLITALYVDNQQAAALQACRNLRDELNEQGIAPSAVIDELQTRILRQEAVNLPARGGQRSKTTIIDPQPLNPAQLRDNNGRVHRISTSGFKIGRDDDNHLVLEPANVSRHHALIFGAGANFVLKDRNSANGIYVNGARVVNDVVLSDGDTIGIGDTLLTFETSDVN